MKAIVKVRLKKAILDPQGKAVNTALHHLGFETVSNVRVGKLIEMDIKAADINSAKVLVEEACSRLLTNPVIEDYSYELVGEKK